MVSSLQLHVHLILKFQLLNAMPGHADAGCKREKPQLFAYFMQQFSETLNGGIENKLISILLFPRVIHSFSI